VHPPDAAEYVPFAEFPSEATVPFNDIAWVAALSTSFKVAVTEVAFVVPAILPVLAHGLPEIFNDPEIAAPFWEMAPVIVAEEFAGLDEAVTKVQLPAMFTGVGVVTDAGEVAGTDPLLVLQPCWNAQTPAVNKSNSIATVPKNQAGTWSPTTATTTHGRCQPCRNAGKNSQNRMSIPPLASNKAKSCMPVGRRASDDAEEREVVEITMVMGPLPAWMIWDGKNDACIPSAAGRPAAVNVIAAP
jgi:hypothetical protein